MTKKHRAKIRPSATQLSARTAANAAPIRLPFIEHVRELRRRLFCIAVSVAVWGVVAYGVERQIVAALLRPAHGQNFIYTSPIDGVNFLFKLCAYVGIACSIPVIVYQLLRFIEPLMQRKSAQFIRSSVVASGILAAVGMLFGYFIGLPTALYFLLHQFVSAQIHPLLTIDAYLSFVIVYMLGSALMFQIPLVIVFINRIKPLTPRGLWKRERWAILLAVVAGGIMNPTPNLLDQFFVIGPIIVSYQLGIVLVWWQNRRPKHLVRLQALRDEDARAQAARQEHIRSARHVQSDHLVAMVTAAVQPPIGAPVPLKTAVHPRQYANTFTIARRSLFM